MKNLLLLLLLANILYLVWGMFGGTSPEPGVVIVSEADLGPPLAIAKSRDAETATNVGIVLGSGQPSALDAFVGRTCVTIGPFRASEDAEAARSQYAGEGMRTAMRTTTGEIFVGHWVQIGNIADQQSGNDMLTKLHAGGLADAYLVRADEGGYFISLGLFGSLDGAEKVELQAKSLDLPAEITARTQEGSMFFVDIALPPGKGAGAMIERFGEEKVLLRDGATCPKDR
jgi:hypothetical protein